MNAFLHVLTILGYIIAGGLVLGFIVWLTAVVAAWYTARKWF